MLIVLVSNTGIRASTLFVFIPLLLGMLNVLVTCLIHFVTLFVVTLFQD